MQINFHAHEFKTDVKLLDYVEQKVGKLAHYFEQIIDADVYLSLEGKKHIVRDKTLTLKLRMPGNTIVTTETCLSFEEACDVVVEHAKRQLTKYKEKLHQH